VETPETTRVRVWLLFDLEDAATVAADIEEKYVGFDEYNEPIGGDDWIVVRAEVVSGGSFNLVVPVDVVDDDELEDLLADFEEELDIVPAEQLKVDGHRPWPPHKAHCFLTGNEHEQGGDYSQDFKVGRNPQSPGSNAWG
jgi:hypothetical protein